MTPLRAIRCAHAMKQIELARRLGISQSHLSRVETCQDKASPELAERIAQIFGISEMEVLYPHRYMPTGCADTAPADR